MASLQKLVLPAASRVARLSSHHFRPKYSHKAKILPFVRSVHIPNNDNDPTPPQKLNQAPAPRTPHPPRHEVQERTESLSVPGFNPPGGGGGPGPGGSSVFQITRSPMFDAALTTIIGLGMGERSKGLDPWSAIDLIILVFVGGIAYVRWYKKNVLDKASQIPFVRRSNKLIVFSDRRCLCRRLRPSS